MEVQCKKCLSTDYTTSESGQHIKATCTKCKSFIKFLPQGRPLEVMPYGKYKGEKIKDMRSEEHIRYFKWLIGTELKGNVKDSVIAHLNSLNRGVI